MSAEQPPNDPNTGLTPAAQALAHWIHSRQTGCFFAVHLIAKDRFCALTFPRAVGPETLDPLMDAAANRSQAVFLVFPFIRSEAQLIEQLNALSASGRWTLKHRKKPKVVTDDVFVGIEWTTSSGALSMPMGFGPFPTMPTTRRAPQVALAVWPAGQMNELNEFKKEGKVDFLDAKHDLEPAHYKSHWDRSVADTTALLAEPPDSSKNYRDVAFRLAGASRASIRFSGDT